MAISQVPQNAMDVTTAQNSRNFRSKACLISAEEISTKRSTGSVTVKLNLLADARNPSLIIFTFFKKNPKAIIMNNGIVAFSEKTKLLMATIINANSENV